METTPQINPLKLIGTALWIGVLAFGAVAWFLHRNGMFPVSPQPMSLRYAQVGVCIGCVLAALALRKGAAAAPVGPGRRSKILSIWALGEGGALFGGVLLLLTNEPQWYALGLLAMLTTYVVAPPIEPG